MTALEGKALLDHGKAIARRYAKRVGPEVAEELRAEAVLRALRSPPPDGCMEPWLERIYHNLFVDLWRRGRVVTVEIDAASELAGKGTPEEEVLRRERRHRVRESLCRLPREARRALLSKYYGELDERDAAVRFGIAAATVRTRIHRALYRLRACLGDLRSFCPLFFGKLGFHAGAVGLAPVIVAALAVLGTSAPTPEPEPQTKTEVVEPPARLAPTVRYQAPSASMQSRARIRVAKKTSPAVSISAPASQPEVQTVVMEYRQDERVVGEILRPEGIDILAEPTQPTSPCLVEAPPNLVSQVEKMIEDRL